MVNSAIHQIRLSINKGNYNMSKQGCVGYSDVILAGITSGVILQNSSSIGYNLSMILIHLDCGNLLNNYIQAI